MENHELMGGKLHVYRRENSGKWQCSTYLAGKNWRTSTREESLAHAKDFAEDWYLELRGKNRAKLLRVGKTFKEAAEQFVREFSVIIEGERNPDYVEGLALRKILETNANGEVISYTNDSAGDLLTLTDGKGQTTTWNYDLYGRMTNKLDQSNTVVLTYQYDADSRLTLRSNLATGDTSYYYDNVGNLTEEYYTPNTTEPVTYEYDALNRLTNMVDAVGTTVYTYTSGGFLYTEDGPFDNDIVTNYYTSRLHIGLGLRQPVK